MDTRRTHGQEQQDPPLSTFITTDTSGDATVNNVGRDMITIKGDYIENHINPDSGPLFSNFVVPDAAYDSRVSRSSCLDGTRELVISTITGWKDEVDARPMCWLSGPAGFGKSAVSQTVAELCASKGTLAASFFFLRGAGGRSEFKHFITTLAFQITISIPDIKKLVLKALQDDPSIPHQSTSNQLQKLILEPLLALPETLLPNGGFLVVIDALDECNDRKSIQDFIAVLASACSSQNPPLRWLLTSRGEEHIRQSFSNEVPSAATLVMQLEDFNAHTDIRTFLEARFSEIIKQNQPLFRRIPLPWPSTREFEALVKKSSGLFIFASTLVNFITDGNGPPDEKLQSVLEMHAGLDPLYDQVLRSVSPKIICFRRVLEALMIFYEQPSVEQLADTLQLGIAAVVHALMAIQSIITIPTNDSARIQLNHTSLRDFLVDKDRAKDLSINPPMAHATLANDCVKLLHRNLRQDMFPRDLATRYAAKYWPRHSMVPSHASETFPELLASVQDFSSSQVIESWINILMNTGFNEADTLFSEFIGNNKPREGAFIRVLTKINKKMQKDVRWPLFLL